MKTKNIDQYISLIDEIINDKSHLYTYEQIALLKSLKHELKENISVENLILIIDLIIKVIIAGTNNF